MILERWQEAPSWRNGWLLQQHEKPQLLIQDLPVTLPICHFTPFKKEFNGSSNFAADVGRMLDRFPFEF
jgi:hypothetical protein